MFSKFRNWFRRWFNKGLVDHSSPTASETVQASTPEPQTGNGHPVPYDENLLEKARLYWQLGDWQSLMALERDVVQHHPDRARLAAMAAAGHAQRGDVATARQWLRLAQDWGCSQKLIARVLISGIHNSLGNASLLVGDEKRALAHFTDAIQSGMPGMESRVMVSLRIRSQMDLLGEETAIPFSELRAPPALKTRLEEE